MFIHAKNTEKIVCNISLQQCIPLKKILKRGGFMSNCVEGYEGPLCGSCKFGYSKFGASCFQCKDATINFFEVISLFLLLAILVGLLIMFDFSFNFLFIKIFFIFKILA